MCSSPPRDPVRYGMHLIANETWAQLRERHQGFVYERKMEEGLCVQTSGLEWSEVTVCLAKWNARPVQYFEKLEKHTTAPSSHWLTESVVFVIS